MTPTMIFCTLLFMAADPKTATIDAVRQYALNSTKSLSNDTRTLTIRHTTRPPNAINDPAIETTLIQAGPLQRQVENLLAIIFEPATAADLRWNRAANLNGHKVDVIAFHVPQPSGYALSQSGRGILVPFEGFVFADAQTHAVLRIQMKCTMIPDDSAIRNFDLTLDYNAAQLPSHFVLHYLDSRADRQVVDDGQYGNKP